MVNKFNINAKVKSTIIKMIWKAKNTDYIVSKKLEHKILAMLILM